MSAQNTRMVPPKPLSSDRAKFEKLSANSKVSAAHQPLSELDPSDRAQGLAFRAQQLINDVHSGQLPDTATMTEVLNQLQHQVASSSHTTQLTPEGRQLTQYLQDLIVSTQRVLQEKNPDNKLQQAVFHASQAAQNASAAATQGGVGDSVKNTAERHGRPTADMGKNLVNQVTSVGRLIVTSGTFRQLLVDLTQVIQEVVANRIPAGSGELEEGSAVSARDGQNQPMDRHQQNQQHQQHEQHQHQKQPQQRTSFQQPMTKGANRHGHSHQERNEGGHSSGRMQGGQGQSSAEEGGSPLRSALTGSSDGQMTQKNLPRLSRDQEERLTNRLRDLLREAQTHPQYRSALSEIINLLGGLRRHLADMTHEISGQVDSRNLGTRSDLDISISNSRDLIERFAGGYSTVPLERALRNFMDTVRHDRRLSAVWRQNREFVLHCLEDGAFLDSDQFTDEAHRIMGQNREVLHDHSHRALDTIGQELNALAQGFQSDPATRQWGGDMQRVAQHLFLDASGKPVVKDQLLTDAAQILPQLVQAVRFIPLPRVEYDDGDYECAVDNMVVSLSNILPDQVTVATRTDMRLADGVLERGAHRVRERQARKTAQKERERMAETVKVQPPVGPGVIREPTTTRAHGYGAGTGVPVDNTINTTRRDRKNSSSSSSWSSSSSDSESNMVASGRRRSSDFGMHHVITFDIRNVVASVQNAVFYFRKKSGLPRMSDAGLADLVMNEHKGLDLRLVVSSGTSHNLGPSVMPNTRRGSSSSGSGGVGGIFGLQGDNNTGRFLRVERVEPRLRSMKLKLHGTKHDIMYKMISPIVNRVLRKRIQKSMGHSIRQFLEGSTSDNSVRDKTARNAGTGHQRRRSTGSGNLKIGGAPSIGGYYTGGNSTAQPPPARSDYVAAAPPATNVADPIPPAIQQPVRQSQPQVQHVPQSTGPAAALPSDMEGLRVGDTNPVPQQTYVEGGSPLGATTTAAAPTESTPMKQYHHYQQPQEPREPSLGDVQTPPQLQERHHQSSDGPSAEAPVMGTAALLGDNIRSQPGL
ncbi:hypothetical protein H4R33_001344 [Dimargaris cristalligena]|nr:hypothetical protein H4R33_001344 [Dimargaris cristalligena]